MFTDLAGPKASCRDLITHAPFLSSCHCHCSLFAGVPIVDIFHYVVLLSEFFLKLETKIYLLTSVNVDLKDVSVLPTHLLFK